MRAVCGNLVGFSRPVGTATPDRRGPVARSPDSFVRLAAKAKKRNMLTVPTEMACYEATKNPDGTTTGAVRWRPLSDLPAGDILIRVRYSSLNYKDAMSATGKPGVTKTLSARARNRCRGPGHGQQLAPVSRRRSGHRHRI